MAEILEAYGALPWIRVWRSNSGVAYSVDCGRAIRFGLKGQADISGIMTGGVRVEIECKSRRGRQTEEQRAFEKMIRAMGGVYILARSLDDVRRVIG